MNCSLAYFSLSYKFDAPILCISQYTSPQTNGFKFINAQSSFFPFLYANIGTTSSHGKAYHGHVTQSLFRRFLSPAFKLILSSEGHTYTERLSQENGNLTIEKSFFKECEEPSGSGGSLSCENVDLNISEVEFSDSCANYTGGSIYIRDCNANIRCTIIRRSHVLHLEDGLGGNGIFSISSDLSLSDIMIHQTWKINKNCGDASVMIHNGHSAITRFNSSDSYSDTCGEATASVKDSKIDEEVTYIHCERSYGHSFFYFWTNDMIITLSHFNCIKNTFTGYLFHTLGTCKTTFKNGIIFKNNKYDTNTDFITVVDCISDQPIVGANLSSWAKTWKVLDNTICPNFPTNGFSLNFNLNQIDWTASILILTLW